MLNIPILPLLIIIPIVGLIFVLLSVEEDENYIQAKNFIFTSFYPHIFLSNLLPQKTFKAPFISL